MDQFFVARGTMAMIMRPWENSAAARKSGSKCVWVQASYLYCITYRDRAFSLEELLYCSLSKV